MTSKGTDSSATPARKSTPASRTAASAAKRTRPQRARSGRRPGDSGTREQILESALHLFADRGYARTTIRAIAEDAQVDPALVHHFFDNKEGVFNAAINSPFSVSSTFDTMAEAESGTSEAAWIARTYLAFWENERTRYAMTAIYRAGLADSATSDVLRVRVEESAKAWANRSGYQDHPGSEVRLALAASHLVGLAIMRYIIGLHPLAEMSYDEFISWVVPSLELRLSAELQPLELDARPQD
ncbi:TetR family transcriptional regulator [Streptomyces sp. NPDC020996]|uniref:TetR/AcrR family transcriptional regulator n=1 Tax=Streptomyces sp. NPDC020996 TaxID=3154791 RepID=UPI0033DD86DC